MTFFQMLTMTIITRCVLTRLVIQPERFWVRILRYYSRIFGSMLEVSISINFYARILHDIGTLNYVSRPVVCISAVTQTYLVT